MKSLLTSLGSRSLDDSSTSDPEFAKLVEELTAQLQDGRALELEQIIEKHPQFADQIRDLMPALEMLARIAESPARPPRASGDAFYFAQHQLGDYRILRELGRGGMGVVYEAEQLSLGRRVALKVLPFAGMLDQQQLARFKNEARAAATLHHEHIVPIHAVGSERGVHFYAMQLVEGQSLAQWIEQWRASNRKLQSHDSLSDGSVMRLGATPVDVATAPAAHLTTVPEVSSREDWHTVARWGMEAASALDHAHQNGILHRDIKPANLLVDGNRKLWVTDFGLARIEHDAGITLSGDLLGTLRYMSPEQALAKRVAVDHRSDIYSLGATLYELITRQPAFGETDRAELLKQIAFQEPRPPRNLNRAIPADLETIVLKAMRKFPEQRYATAKELAEDLQRFLDNKAIQAKPLGWREQIVKAVQRNPAAVWSAFLLLAAVTAICVASIVLVSQAYYRESAQRELAEAERERAEIERVRANGSFTRANTMIRDILVNGARGIGEWSELPPALQAKFADMADTYYEDMLKSDEDPEILYETAVAYRALGVLQASSKHFDQAIIFYRRSIELLDQLCRQVPNEPRHEQQLAWSHYLLGSALNRIDQPADAQVALERATTIYQELISDAPSNADFVGEGWICQVALDKHMSTQGQPANLVTDQIVAILREAAQREPEQAMVQAHLGYVLYHKAHEDEARDALRKAVQLDPGIDDFFHRLLQKLSLDAEMLNVTPEALE